MMDPALYVAIISLKKHHSASFKDGSSPVFDPPAQKQAPLDSIRVIPESYPHVSSPTLSDFDASLFSPASSLLACNRKYSWPLPPRPAVVSTMINSMAQSSYRSISLYQSSTDPLYIQLNSRLSTFIQGL
ncbi:hypothetical protein DSO57_1005572 [Entomophthora muscae]|uniref:Uncharacterized protein n=1 Tax=Entomophthora muscae TaxID=34485 RepID=A0ACC2UHT6_9FUNG|nr:hypothetical protein DSO57_1005572 [Entomophthora muscae]